MRRLVEAELKQGLKLEDAKDTLRLAIDSI